MIVRSPKNAALAISIIGIYPTEARRIHLLRCHLYYVSLRAAVTAARFTR